MSRTEFKPKVKTQAFARCNGLCETCGTKLQVGKYAYDHVIPDGLGGDNSLGNCKVICSPCHSAKTTVQDVPQIAKMKRQHRGHIGAKPKSSLAAVTKQNTATRPLLKTCNRFP